jgi:hypothetical protein
MLQMVESVGLLQTYKFAFSSDEQLAQFILNPSMVIHTLNMDLWTIHQVMCVRQSDGTLRGNIVFSRNGTDMETQSEIIDLMEEDGN